MGQVKPKDLAIKLASEAGQALLKKFKNFKRSSARFKSSHEIVTEADLLAEKIIIKGIRANFPKHLILSEESGKSGAKEGEYLWVVDPLDGTTNFSISNPLWAVSIALMQRIGNDWEIILACVYAPCLDELYWAEVGRGAWLGRKRLHISEFESKRALNTFCHGSTATDMRRAVKYYSRQKLAGFDCRQLGSASLELAFVAAGRVESIVIPGAHAWDVAAGILLVREAGGLVTDFTDKDWCLGSADMVASNGLVHAQIRKIIKESDIL